MAATIVVPMLILAALGVSGLIRDRRAVELQARNEALALCDRLGLRLREELGGLVLEHARASDAAWSRLHHAALGEPPPATVTDPIDAWNRRHPSHPIEQALFPLLEYDREGSLQRPPPPAAVPEPPAWMTSLTREARRLLAIAGTADAPRTSAEERRARWEAFRQKAPPEALAWADFGLTHSRAQEPAAMAAAQLEGFLDRKGLSESGLEVPQLAALERLTLHDAAAAPSPSLRRVLLAAATNAPSAILPRLLALAHGRFPTDPGIESLLRLHGFLEDARTLAPPPGPAQESVGWSRQGSSGPELLVERTPTPSGGPTVRLIPRSLVEETILGVIQALRPPPPDYVGVRVGVAGASFGFETAPGKTGPATRLAAVSPGAEAVSRGLPVEVEVLLASRDRLFAAQGRRQAFMAGWILLAAAGGVGGLIATWRALERQRRLAEERTNFVASVSHELRAPVAAISLMVENMAGGVPLSAERRQEYHRLILRECRRLGGLVENVLDISRIDRGAKRYHPEPTALVPLVAATVDLMRHPAAHSGVVLELELPSTRDLQAVVDGRAIQQALVNLLDNAIKHTPAGGPPVRIALAAGAGEATLSVADRGPGIPPAAQQQIFERFRRLGSELRRETEGVGIGLALTRHILEAHGGTVEVESRPGDGSRFTLRFPLNPPRSHSPTSGGPRDANEVDHG